MSHALFVFLGGGLGSLVRYRLSLHLPQGVEAGAFPWATFAANLIGSLLIGLLMGYFSAGNRPDALRLLFVTGFCGGFTTFSTFSNETLTLLRSGHAATAAAYVALSIAGALLLTFAGYKIMAAAR